MKPRKYDVVCTVPDTLRLRLADLGRFGVKSSLKCQFFFAGRCPAPATPPGYRPGPPEISRDCQLHTDQTPLTLADTRPQHVGLPFTQCMCFRHT